MKGTEVLNPRCGVPQWGYDADTQTCTCQRICGSHGHYPHLHTRIYESLAGFTHFIRLLPVMFAQMFQRLSCGFYALYPSLACSKFAQVFQRLLKSIVLCFIAWDVLPGCALQMGRHGCIHKLLV